ncbi:stromal interaction molecule 1-like isoform X2 [Dinothrombium tinctorium]|uniref:Stromal interaction molecule 1-like isoform X2 n=1 Tax=Dinothrombium tinctorium TaxID=1965070 RepID=A0A443RAE8_9ACAR|nr:stromal interaction molecule 1-like isoform X2 [Dinothrombium tinctorium]
MIINVITDNRSVCFMLMASVLSKYFFYLSGWDCEQLDYCSDKAGFEAIRWLHRKLDDDANGNVDIAESDEFLRDELKYENSHERHKAFHGNDKQISVDELWSAWKVSEVHNWTVEQTVEWLSTNVELPQYADLFINHGINGTFLPRLASSFAIGYGIKDPIHRQKIALKAMDVVLFGPPKHHNFVKDVLLALSLIIAAGGCWFAYVQHTRSQSHLKKMLKDMESLQRAEDQLTQLQRELDKAQQEQIRVVSEKKTLEEKLKATEVERHFVEKANGFAKEKSLPNISDFNRIYELEAELNEIKQQLNRAETALKSKSWVPPQELQNWLKITFKIESQNIEIKRRTAILQMESAKRACEKLNRTRSSFLGSFKVAHGSTIDEVDQQLIEAKASLSKVISEIQERTFNLQTTNNLLVDEMSSISNMVDFLLPVNFWIIGDKKK